MVENMQLHIALRCLKSDNLKKRLNGLGDIRTMIDRMKDTLRYHRYRNKFGGDLNKYMHWKANNANITNSNMLPLTALTVG
jgi:hypothetical protein